jgi:hypothetical protein
VKLHTLNLFLRSLIEPLAQTGAPADQAENLRRACDLLSSFGEMNVGQFGDLLQQTKEYQTSKQHAFPGHLQPVIRSFESLRSLKGRASAPDVNRDELVRDLHDVPLDSLEVKDLSQLATEQGWEVKPKAKKGEVINLIWRGITGADKPKKARASAKRTPKPKVTVSLDEYAQKINEMKERANSFEVTREELEKGLDALGLDKLSQKDLVALAKQLSRDVNARTKKSDAIDAIRRIVLDVKELLVGSAG